MQAALRLIYANHIVVLLKGTLGVNVDQKSTDVGKNHETNN